ncbi:MAG: ribose-phosphate diphosphokinase [Nitrososphaerota archaeon]|nr:ribose-phosphate diphosphokinase [Candidatus Calditenuaceae archaeon]MDW8073347.1 ribose-phosphate diphosphokinase [Nitrososphaerota archaeon]
MEGVSLVAGPASRELGERIAESLGLEPMGAMHKLFPDGESYFRFLEKPRPSVILVQGTHPPQDKHLLQLLLMSKGLRELGANRIVAVVPYLAYARQDRAFLEGETVSLRVVLQLMKSAGVDEIITVNPHAPWALKEHQIRAHSISVARSLSLEVRRHGWQVSCVVSPGKKGMELATEAAEELGAEPVRAESWRDPATGEVRVEVEAGHIFSNKRVMVIDDVVSTGGTMSRLIRMLKSANASKIYACCIHGLFIEGSDKKILEAGADAILATNTVPNKYAEVDVSGELAAYLARMFT